MARSIKIRFNKRPRRGGEAMTVGCQRSLDGNFKLCGKPVAGIGTGGDGLDHEFCAEHLAEAKRYWEEWRENEDEEVERMFDTPVPCSRCGKPIRVALEDMIVADTEELERLLCEVCGPRRGVRVADRPKPIYVARARKKAKEPDACRHCGAKWEPRDRHCGKCGRSLRLRCDKCDAAKKLGQRFCDNCGRRLKAGGPRYVIRFEAKKKPR